MTQYILNPFIIVNFGYMITAIIITLIIKNNTNDKDRTTTGNKTT
jgi:hypothetical protein